MKYINSVLEAIGKTHLLKLNKIGKDVDANVFVKLEHLNPSGSYKDRMALAMIEAAEKGETWNGKRILPGATVVDASAGNTAPAVALVCAAKGYKAKIYLYRYYFEKEVDARFKITSAYGPEVKVSSDPRKYISEDEATRLYELNGDLLDVLTAKRDCAQEEEESPNAIWIDQIYNSANYLGQKSIGYEIYDQLDGKIDAIGCSAGSGASLFGMCLAMKERGVKLETTFGVIPEGSEQYIEMEKNESERGEFYITGNQKEMASALGVEKWVKEKSVLEEMVAAGYPDKFFRVSSDEARAMANRLCSEEGIYCGMSSGANVAVALKLASRMKKGQNVVTLIVDRRDRYLSEYPNDQYVV